MSTPDMGSIIHIKNQWNILVIENYYVNYQNYQNLMLLTSSDTKRTLMHIIVYKFRPKRTGFNMYTENTRPQLTFLALHSCIFLCPPLPAQIIRCLWIRCFNLLPLQYTYLKHQICGSNIFLGSVFCIIIIFIIIA